MANKNIKIKSSFTDYYDYLSDDTALEVYKRDRTNTDKVEDLRLLQALGLKTIELQPANRILIDPSKRVIVYTDLSRHNGEGKMLTSLSTVRITYPNKLCSIFHEPVDGIIRTYKFLQIGKRRFWVYITNKGLLEDKVENIQEIESAYNYYLKLPIYSIDYIFANNGLTQLAVDFNSVQNLQKLGIDKLISANDVVLEIYDSLIEYNKVIRQ